MKKVRVIGRIDLLEHLIQNIRLACKGEKSLEEQLAPGQKEYSHIGELRRLLECFKIGRYVFPSVPFLGIQYERIEEAGEATRKAMKSNFGCSQYDKTSGRSLVIKVLRFYISPGPVTPREIAKVEKFLIELKQEAESLKHKAEKLRLRAEKKAKRGDARRVIKAEDMESDAP